MTDSEKLVRLSDVLEVLEHWRFPVEGDTEWCDLTEARKALALLPRPTPAGEMVRLEDVLREVERSANMSGMDTAESLFTWRPLLAALRLLPRTSSTGGEEMFRDALEWYADKVSACRKLTSEGDVARQELDRDGGNRARAALQSTGER